MSGITVYEPQDGGSIPIYIPQHRQSGGGLGLGRRLGGAFHRYVAPKLESLKDDVVDRGTKALTNVASEVLEGKDLKQALEDETTQAKVDLKRKIDTASSKIGGIRKSLKPARNYSKSTLNALFD